MSRNINSFAKACLFATAFLTLAGCAGGGGGPGALLSGDSERAAKLSGSNSGWINSSGDKQLLQQAIAKSDHLIVPGERIGPVHLGMAMDEVTNMLGKPNQLYINHGDPLKIQTQMKYPSLNLIIYFDQTPTPMVTSIEYGAYSSTTRTLGNTAWSDLEPVSSDFHTAEGLTVGSTSYDASRLYGQYDYNSAIDMNFKQLKMRLIVSNDHRVYSISITN